VRKEVRASPREAVKRRPERKNKILMIQNANEWTGLIWLMIPTNVGVCQHSHEAAALTNEEDILEYLSDN
jgi:hypothetical protein